MNFTEESVLMRGKMDASKWLNLPVSKLNDELIGYIISFPREGEKIVEQLLVSERYTTDYAFRILVDTAKGMAYGAIGDYSKVIPDSLYVLEHAIEYELWPLAALNWNLVGNAYYVSGLYERAFECYNNVIRVEEKMGVSNLKSAAYNNIALIFSNLEDKNKTLEYLELALKALEEGGEDQPRYLLKLVYFLSDKVVALCNMNRLDEANDVLNRLRKIDINDISAAGIWAYSSAIMHYAMFYGNFKLAKRAFEQGREAIREIDTYRNIVLHNQFLKLCLRFDLEIGYYESTLDEALQIGSSGLTVVTLNLYETIRKIDMKLGLEEKLSVITARYLRLLELYIEERDKQQLSALTLISELSNDGHNHADPHYAMQLKLIADEALQNKMVIEKAYYTIQLISEIGRKLTATLDMEDILDLIHQNLKIHIPVDTFVMMVYEPEEERLHSVVHYQGNVQMESLEIDVANPNSIFVKCFRSGEVIVSHDPPRDPQFAGMNLVQLHGSGIMSVVYLPLKVGGQVIGVFSLQSRTVYQYEEKDVEFMEGLLPYIAIALNNAVKSQRLEQEIASHKETQRELREANKRLERLSFLDGLTQISNRRDFEMKILDLLREAKNNDKNVSVFMFDIDNFKLFNDTYGHLEGDEALKAVAQAIREHVDKLDGLSARFGGEEFIAACSGLSDEESIALAEKIRKHIWEQGIPNEKAPLGILSVSVGVATAMAPESSMKSDIMRWADYSLYQAKNDGKNKVVFKRVNPGEKAPEGLE